MTAEPSRYPVPRWYLILTAGVAIVAVCGLILGIIGQVVNNQQGRENAHLLGCLDQYASTSSTATAAVRDAAAARDPGVVADHVNISERFERRLRRPLDAGEVGHVTDHSANIGT